NEADAAAFLPQVDENSISGRADELHRRQQLGAAVAAQRPKQIPCLAFRMHPYDRGAVEWSVNECDMLFFAARVGEDQHSKFSEHGRQPAFDQNLDLRLVLRWHFRPYAEGTDRSAPRNRRSATHNLVRFG